MDLYVDIEHTGLILTLTLLILTIILALILNALISSTGRDSQFYEKFNVRYQIACLFKYLWGIPVHKVT